MVWYGLCPSKGILSMETRVTGPFRKPALALALFSIVLPSAARAQAGGQGKGHGITPQIIGTEAHFNVSQFNPPKTIAVESTLVVTVQVHNYTATAGSFRITCTATGQVRCTDATPGDLRPLGAGGYSNASITVHGYGLGTGSVTVKLYGVSSGGDPLVAQSTSQVSPQMSPSSGGGTEVLDDTELRSFSVIGEPMVAHVIPADDGVRSFNVPMQASFTQPVNLASVRVWMGTQEVTSSITKSAAGYSASPALAGGTYTWKTYACKATVARCEYFQTGFYQVGSSTWELDDSLPLPDGFGIVGLLGGLPLPPPELRGCPEQQSAPEIRIDQPSSFLSQPAANGLPGGLVFAASVSANDLLSIKTITVDHSDTDPTTCADYGYIDGEDFNYNWWTGTSPTDTLWTGYPYGDLAFDAVPDGGMWPPLQPGINWPRPVTGTAEPTPLWRSRIARAPRQGVQPATWNARVPDPGAINTATLKIWST